MDLQALLGDTPAKQFVASFYQRLPYSATSPAATGDLASWEVVTAILAQESAAVLVCRRNELLSSCRPQTVSEARRLVEQGCTLLVKHAERHDQRLAEIAAAFQRDFAAPVNVHIYLTPSGEYGFGWHYDAEEVFIVQTAGRKTYSLRKNTVNPWPLEETLPADMQYEREIMPLWRCELATGGWLYIPSGYWHRAEAKELAFSVAIGVQARAAIEMWDFLRTQLLESLVWRQRLPVTGALAPQPMENIQRDLEGMFRSLSTDLAARLADARQVAAFLEALHENQTGFSDREEAAP